MDITMFSKAMGQSGSGLSMLIGVCVFLILFMVMQKLTEGIVKTILSIVFLIIMLFFLLYGDKISIDPNNFSISDLANQIVTVVKEEEISLENNIIAEKIREAKEAKEGQDISGPAV